MDDRRPFALLTYVNIYVLTLHRPGLARVSAGLSVEFISLDTIVSLSSFLSAIKKKMFLTFIRKVGEW